MSVFNSPSSPSSDHIRHLLHQRTAPALTTHGHFPSVTDIPDSPSIYSHSQFTPRPFDKNEPTASPYHFSRFDNLPRTPVADRNRFSHADSSILDLEDDSHSSCASSSTYDPNRNSHVAEYSHEERDDPEHRMSMLGIKMRFHSKAPWELGGNDIVEEVETDHVPPFRPPSRSKRSLKSFGSNRRPSGDSSRSGSTGKKSSESSSQLSARRAMHTLAQASMSVSSLALTSPPSTSKEKEMSLRQKLSLPRLRARSTSNSTTSSFVSHIQYNVVGNPHPSNSSTQDLFPLSKASSPTRSEYSPVYLDTGSIVSRSPSPVGHPYANPELARSFVSDTEHSHDRSKSPQEIPMVNSNDSHATLTVGTKSNSIDRPTSTFTPTMLSSPSITSRDQPRTREISAPIPLSPSVRQSSNHRETRVFQTSLGNGIAGWQEPQPSTFTLISLEEARAQRTRTLPTRLDNTEPLSFPQVEQNQAPPGPNILTKPRGRSTSASGKSKIDSTRSYILKGKSEPTTPDSVTSQGKTLKHKKSGFMRIFSGRDKDTVSMPSPPPTSTLFEVIPPVPRTPKVSTHRVPVPSIVSPKHDSEPVSTFPNSLPGVTVDEHPIDHSTSPKRVIPALSVKTSASAKRLFGSAHFSSVSNDSLPPAPSFSSSSIGKETSPRSAPPGTTDFIGLRLRPVSAMFSSHFTDHLLEPEVSISERGSEPSLMSDSGTRSTTMYSDMMSPLSADYSFRGSQQSGVDRLGSIMLQDERQSDTARALQDQISSAKKAWQRHIWELEGLVRDLKTEIEELRQVEDGGEYCTVCGRGPRSAVKEGSKVSLFSRPSIQSGLSS